MSAAKTILVIDDNAEFRGMMIELLRCNGWQTLDAGEGDEGILLAKQHRPRVILCDLLMPRCNGFQVCRTLREDDSLRGTHIIAISGRDFKSDRQEAFEAGANEYLTKPLVEEQLLSLLARLAAKSGSEKKKIVSPLSVPSTPMLLRFWGVRGSTPAPGPGTVHYGGNTSCIEVRAGDQIIILDAGTGLRLLGRALTAEFKDQPMNLTLLLTHTHWDHIQGLPFFQPIYKPQNRLRILGYEGARIGLRNVLSSQMESPYFPVALGEVPGNIEIEELKAMNFTIGPVNVRAAFAHHPGICVGYRLSTAAGSIVYLPDNEANYPLRRFPEHPSGKESSLEFAQGQDRQMADFLHGADALIMDTQYDSEEYKEHVGWGHGCLDDVVALSLKAEVKKLFLFHHDPDHDDAKVSQMVEHAKKLVAARRAALQIEAATEGATVELRVKK